METVNIDLEQEPQEESAELDVTPGEKEADESVESNFPHFHFETPTALNIPEKGVMQVEYEIVYDEGDEEGGYVYKVDLHRIVGVEPEGAPAKPEGTEAALDRLAAARMKENENVQS